MMAWHMMRYARCDIMLHIKSTDVYSDTLQGVTEAALTSAISSMQCRQGVSQF